MRVIGIISDTHGLLRPEAVAALEGSDVILHAGDVGDPAILDRLAEIAPVHAVHGNTDFGRLREELPETEVVEVADGVLACVLHILEDLDLDPAAADIAMVVYGHTHRPRVERRSGVLYLNPGSAGPRRFTLPVSVARVRVSPAPDASGRAVLDPEIVELDV